MESAHRALEAAAALDNECDRIRHTQFAVIPSLIAGDLATATETWDRIDLARQAALPAAACGGAFVYGRLLAATGDPTAIEQFDRAIEMARDLKWTLVEYVALSESAALLAASGDIPAARNRLSDAMGAWLRSGDRNQLWTTLHHLTMLHVRSGDTASAQEIWAQLKERAAFVAEAHRAQLVQLFGEPPPCTMTDDQLVAWAQELADHLQ
jgi:hypothetical protein